MGSNADFYLSLAIFVLMGFLPGAVIGWLVRSSAIGCTALCIVPFGVSSYFIFSFATHENARIDSVLIGLLIIGIILVAVFMSATFAGWYFAHKVRFSKQAGENQQETSLGQYQEPKPIRSGEADAP